MTAKPARPLVRLGDILLDGAALGGSGLIVHGIDLVYRPAAFMAAGTMLLAGAWFVARKGG